MLIQQMFEFLAEEKKKFGSLEFWLFTLEKKLVKILDEMKTGKKYGQLQLLEEVLRRSLIRTLETKGEVAVVLMKKDFEMNKDLISKLQEQAQTQQSQQKPHPRFGSN